MNDPVELVGVMRLIGVDGEGAEHPFLVGVGIPRQQPTGEWACPTLCHDFEKPRAIHGQDSLQALCLGLSFVRLRLEDFVEKGGRLFLPDGRDEISRQDFAAWFSRVGGLGNG
jgi:hypothetical protein